MQDREEPVRQRTVCGIAVTMSVCDVIIGDATMSRHRMTSRSTDERQQRLGIGSLRSPIHGYVDFFKSFTAKRADKILKSQSNLGNRK